MFEEVQMVVCLGEKDANNQGKTAEAWLQHQAEKEVWKVRQLELRNCKQIPEIKSSFVLALPIFCTKKKIDL